MSAASRSAVRRIASAFFLALAAALLILSVRTQGQVYIPDPCKGLEPGSFLWYFHLCFLDSAFAEFVRSMLWPASSGFLVR